MDKLMKYERLIYVCSPYADDPIGNAERARLYAKEILDCGMVPVVPHLLYPQFLDEETDREIGLKCGIELMKKCDEVWVFGDHISEGMQAEIKLATELGMIIHGIGIEL